MFYFSHLSVHSVLCFSLFLDPFQLSFISNWQYKLSPFGNIFLLLCYSLISLFLSLLHWILPRSCLSLLLLFYVIIYIYSFYFSVCLNHEPLHISQQNGHYEKKYLKLLYLICVILKSSFRSRFFN